MRGDDSAAKMAVEQRLREAARNQGAPGYTIFWGCNQRSGASAGVAILVRTDLLATARLAVGKVVASEDGRQLSLKCEWEGHRLTLLTVYLPSGDSGGQREFIRGRLRQAVAAATTPVVVMGDLNFAPDWRVDRAGQAGAAEGAYHRDTATAAAMTQLCGDHSLVDAFRHLHPTRRGFTYHSSSAASRLDHVYVSCSMLPHVHQCGAAGSTTSDHRPVVLHLRPATLRAKGPGLPRGRMAFWGSQSEAEEFTQWLHERVELAPEDDAALLQWWPSFKQEVLVEIRRRDKAFGAARAGSSTELVAARAELAAAYARLDSASTAEPAGVADVMRCRRRARALAANPAKEQQLRDRHLWIRHGEQPPSLVAELTRRPAAAGQVPAVRDRGGGLLLKGPLIANEVAAFFAAVSAAPGPQPAARAAVLRAVASHAERMPRAAADAAGSRTISVAEVTTAVKRSKMGTAPGPDGLPAALWRRGGAPMHGLLAAVFTAMGRLDHLPPGLLDGVLVPIFKAGDAAALANYRPITLLNTDYRLLAKVLAARLAGVLAMVIGPEQTAFMPGRLIGDNIALLQLLPELLRSRGLSGAVAFLDFRKAYDTIDRDFLFEVMEATGAGGGLAQWARLLLRDTSARANVNGFVSDPVQYMAGVRQGCPLSPALYLFVAWALSCWLQDCTELGLEVDAGLMLRCLQFADDTQALLRSVRPEDVQRFVDHMGVFGDASGQRLNLDKCKLLAIGAVEPGAPAPGVVAGLRGVLAATSLGITFSSAPGPVEDWQPLLDTVKQCYSKVARLPLSIFGRSHAAATYGVSRLLFRAEHVGMPTEVVEQMQRWDSALVDRQQAPGPRRPGARPVVPGVHTALLPGKPRQGGFGALPWRQHVLARHAMLARRFLIWSGGGPAIRASLCRVETCSGAGLDAPRVAAQRPLWVPVADALLRRLFPGAHPALAMLQACHEATAEVAAGRVAGTPLPPGPLRRMAAGLQALGPPVLVEGPEPPGPQYAGAPLWGNEQLQLERRVDQRSPAALEVEPSSEAVRAQQDQGFWPMASMPGLRTVRDLMLLSRHLSFLDDEEAHMPEEHRYDWLMGTLYGYDPRAAPIRGLPQLLSAALRSWAPRDTSPMNQLTGMVRALCMAVPIAWREGAIEALRLEGFPAARQPPCLSRIPDHAAEGQWVERLVGRIGWLTPRAPMARGRSLRQGGALPNGGRVCVRLAGPPPTPPMKVKSATLVQLGGVVEARRAIRAAYVTDALAEETGAGALPPAAAADAAQEQLEQGMQQLWRVPWENQRKETLWRLTVNGVAAAGGHDIIMPGPCPCGCPRLPTPRAARLHAFWGCPVAQAVVEQLRLCLPAGARPLRCADVWLLRPPAGVHAGVWGVVCAAALDAMAHGRRALWAVSRGVKAPDPRQTLITDYLPVVRAAGVLPPLTGVQRAERSATAWLWTQLQDFVELRGVPAQWGDEVLAAHPFVGVAGSAGSARLQLSLPDGLQLLTERRRRTRS